MGKLVAIKLVSGVTTYPPTAFQEDFGTPQEYTQNIVSMTVAFEDPLHNTYRYTMLAIGDKVKFYLLLGVTPYIQVWVAGVAHSYPAVYLKVDTTSPCGTA